MTIRATQASLQGQILVTAALVVMAKSFLSGALLGLVYVPIHNVSQRRFRN